MFDKHKGTVLSCNDEALNEIHITNTLLNALLTYCQNKEFIGEYYGIPENFIHLLSEERNEYISLINTALEKLNIVKHLLLHLENKLSLLQKNPDYSRR